jgi:hypothetical protein
MLALRFVVTVFALLFVASGQAAVSVSDRSPFAQGHWWDPARAGSGFDIFNANGQVGVVWFTFDEIGRPIWYTAGGALASMGTQSWSLLKHRWSNGRRENPTVVGSLRINLRHPESADLTWDIGGKQGTWAIQPLTVSGVVNEIDHSGHWFDPGNSGWGFSLVEQGDVLGGALFTYDANGEPTWVSGFQRGTSSVEYLSFKGSCPYCSYQMPTSSSAGRLAFDFAGETQLTVRNSLSVPMAAGTNVDGARVVQLGRAASTRPADRQLASFDADAALKAYLHTGMLNVPPQVTSSFSASPPAAAFSPTNLQESGVDEADVVKSDGRFVYTFAHNSAGQRLPAVRVAQVADEGAGLVVLGSVPLASGAGTPLGSAGLYVYADKLVSVTGSQPFSYGGPVWASPSAWIQGTTYIEVMKTDSTLPVTRWRVEIDGNIVASRRIGARLYVVSRFVPWLAGFTYGANYQPYLASNQQLLANASLPALLPKVRVDGGAANPLVEPSAVYAPPQGSRPPMADMVLVSAIDLDAMRIAQSIAILGTADTVYASSANLFVATSRYASVYPGSALLPVEPPFYLTDVHQIRLGADAMSIVGSASLEGYLANDPEKASFRLSEYQGRLRAVTSSVQMWGSAQQNRLTILEPSTLAPGLLKTVSYLPNKRRPETLGKPYELLYGTRFLADRLYAGDVQEDRSAVCRRSRGQHRSPHRRRAGGTGLLRVPAPVAERPLARVRQGRETRGRTR